MKWLLLITLLVSSLLVTPRVFADDTSGTVVIPTPTPAIEYTLPYPGILPDHPLYPLKMARDKIILLLITDPEKKAEFNLLQADKRIQAAVYLVEEDKRKGKLAVNTIDKGENYFHDAVEQTVNLKKQGREVGGLLSSLDHAASKHIDLLSGLTVVLPQDAKELSQIKKRMQLYQDRIHQSQK